MKLLLLAVAFHVWAGLLFLWYLLELTGGF
jgi:hypothetical protein